MSHTGPMSHPEVKIVLHLVFELELELPEDLLLEPKVHYLAFVEWASRLRLVYSSKGEFEDDYWCAGRYDSDLKEWATPWAGALKELKSGRRKWTPHA